MKSKKPKPHTGTSVNRRDVVYKYFPVDHAKSVAVIASRCRQCYRITTDYCSNCHAPLCAKHDKICKNCKSQKKKQDYII